MFLNTPYDIQGPFQQYIRQKDKRKSNQKTAPPKKKATSTAQMAIITVLLLGGAAYFQFILKKDELVNVDATTTKKVIEVPVVDNRPILRVALNDLIPAATILASFPKPKCSTDTEKFLCATYPLIFQGKGGTVLIDKHIIIMIEGEKYAAEANTYLKVPLSIEAGGTQEALDAYQIDLSMMTLMLWMKKNIPLEVKDLDGVKDYKLVIAFVDSSRPEATLVGVSFFIPESFPRLRQKIQEKNFTDAKRTGASEFSYAHEYLRFP